MWGFALTILCFFVLSEFFIEDMCWKDDRMKSKFLERIAEEDGNYFGRLSNIDRKRWISEEIYCRNQYGIKILNDQALDEMMKTPGRMYKLANDPHGYNILDDQQY